MSLKVWFVIKQKLIKTEINKGFQSTKINDFQKINLKIINQIKLINWSQ